MPLDTQPLSRTRRILMLATLLTFLAASLAFAQYLVLHKKTPPLLTTHFTPFGFTTRIGATLADETEAYVGAIAGHPRRLDILNWQIDDTADLEEQASLASDRFIEIMNVPPEETVAANLAHIPGVEAHGTDPNGRFAMLRLAIAGDHVLAVCYTGPRPHIPIDDATFDALCSNGIRFNKE